MGERIRRAGQVAWALVGLAVVLSLLGVIGWWLRVVWPPLILAGAIVFLLNPGVTALHRRHVPRVAGTALSYLAFFAVIGLTVLVVAPLAADQADELSAELPQVRADVERWINDRAEQSKDWVVSFPSVGQLEDEVGGGQEAGIGRTLDAVRDLGERLFHVAIILILAPIIAFYLLVDLPRLRQLAEQLVPEEARDEVLIVATRLNRAVGGFFRGQLLVALVVGAMVSIGLALIDLPFWLIVGMIAGLFNVVPLIGPWVGAVPGILIALTTRDISTAVWVGAIMAGAQQVDNHFISPLVMQRAVRLHPAAVMLALLAGGTIGGFFGLLIAVPAAAVLKIVLGHLWHTYVLGEPLVRVEAAAEADESDPARGIVRQVTDEALQPAPEEVADGGDGSRPDGSAQPEPMVTAGAVADGDGAGPETDEGGEATSTPVGQAPQAPQAPQGRR
ncbi:MAG TPA: AI-2E family transporter [Acidimicrobiales bacterium]|nr:AI-2E family transporter [Acidimicrobiales bacterium]